MTQTVLLRLDDNGEPMRNRAAQHGVLILPAVPKSSREGEALMKLVIHIDAGSPITNNGTLFINVPGSANDEFDRNKYTEHSLDCSFHQDISIAVPIYHPGPYSYFIKYHVGDEKIQTETFNSTPLVSRQWSRNGPGTSTNGRHCFRTLPKRGTI